MGLGLPSDGSIASAIAASGGRALPLPQYLGVVGLGNVFGFGHAGVDFFFVLSGFIIAHIHYGDIGRPDRIGRYCWRRVIRIYPVYWLVTAAVIVLLPFSSRGLDALPVSVLLESLTLLPLGNEPIVNVAWTLEHEMLFYAAFGLTILSRAFGRVLLVCGVLIAAAAGIAGLPGGLAGFLTSPFHLEFLMGIAAARWLAVRPPSAPFATAALGIGVFVLAALLESRRLIGLNELRMVLLYGAGSTLIVAGFAAAEQAGRIVCGRAAVLFGGSSYALYLIHPVLVGLTARGLSSTGLLHQMPVWMVVILQTGIAVTAAIVFHIGIEQPLMRRLRHLKLSFRQRPAVRAEAG